MAYARVRGSLRRRRLASAFRVSLPGRSGRGRACATRHHAAILITRGERIVVTLTARIKLAAYWFIVVVKICPHSHWKVSTSARSLGPVSRPTRRIVRGHEGHGTTRLGRCCSTMVHSQSRRERGRVSQPPTPRSEERRV